MKVLRQLLRKTIKISNNFTIIITYENFEEQVGYRRGGVEVECPPRMREIGVRSPVATDLSRKNRL